MSEPVLTPGDEPRKPVSRGWRRWLTVVAVVVIVSGVVTAIAVIARHGDEAGAPATPTAVATSTTPPTSSSTMIPTATTTATTLPTRNRPSAATALAPFFAAATKLDQRLRTAATAINGAGPPWQQVTDEVAKAVLAAKLAPVAAAIPAGLPPELLRSVILVYSDLVSRRFAMADFAIPLTIDPNAYPNSQDLLNHLANGHPARVRFPADLAATRSLAAATPAVTTLPATSHEAAEVQVYVQYVGLINGGCDSRGGHIMTELPEIVWNGAGGGTLGGGGFTAELGADHTWHIYFNAC